MIFVRWLRTERCRCVLRAACMRTQHIIGARRRAQGTLAALSLLCNCVAGFLSNHAFGWLIHNEGLHWPVRTNPAYSSVALSPPGCHRPLFSVTPAGLSESQH
jgi:hypothetical protein